MPWCETCSRFWNPSSMGDDGSCPTCGRVLAAVPERPAAEEAPYTPPPGEEVRTKVPWHFWVLVVAFLIYLTWRIIQIIGWLIN